MLLVMLARADSGEPNRVTRGWNAACTTPVRLRKPASVRKSGWMAWKLAAAPNTRPERSTLRFHRGPQVEPALSPLKEAAPWAETT